MLKTELCHLMIVNSYLTWLFCMKFLFAINSVSKNLQAKSMCIDNALKQLEGVVLFSKKYINEGFTSNLNIAQSIDHDMNVDHVVANKRNTFRKNDQMILS